MKEITLPDALLPLPDASIGLYDYRIFENSDKQLINLSKNTFSFLQEGHKEVITGDSSVSIKNSRFLLMQAGHCLMTEKVSAKKSCYRSLLLFFSNEAVLELIRRFDIKLHAEPQRKSVYSFEYDVFIQSFVKSMLEISKLPIKNQKNLLSLKFQEIMLYLIEKEGSSCLSSILLDSNQQSQQFMAVVESNKYNKLSLKELAFLTNRSVSSFKREFVKQYAQSPIKWFQDQRLDYASLLLKQEQKRASDIYEEVGYENLSSFIQAFKSKYGVTPKQYQQI